VLLVHLVWPGFISGPALPCIVLRNLFAVCLIFNMRAYFTTALRLGGYPFVGNSDTAPRLDMPGHFYLAPGYLPDQHESLGGPGGQRAGPLWKKLIF
jgi:hypothetical protein